VPAEEKNLFDIEGNKKFIFVVFLVNFPLTRATCVIIYLDEGQ